ncbi:MAG: ATP-binding cassette domain-containing protein [Rhodospirillaceae bacterium]|jgi:branched-chain amino acid transport system permease protein|nr:ATP-binding cassette domain-containing protein [Rhodospirillaceae bacterium]MBT5358759.1 ATP-binding cassette domain-containing protein [Rhodospirillaceae bacterium]MBT5770831.1 ATP-binding cassette domain-containing protein [Rhodospirillaceae bacterium]MBT6309041.1 ATP-binding cassette domain-containing protein [Rhodospirillaceae bacterium]MBT7366104.1 ATP-binding cassette domain-containing protein [Rhodospirillaceae bacterium]
MNPSTLTRHRWPLVAGAGALVIYALFFASSYDQRILTLSGIYVIMVLGYQFIFGHAGALSLAQGAFFGVGAYVTGILASKFGTGFVLTFPLSVAGASMLALIVAVPVLRLASHYFALATLALSQLLLLIAVNWEAVTGGANGLPGVPPISIGDWQATRGLPLLLFVWGLAVVAMLIARWQLRPARVAAFTVMRDTPLAVPAFGIDPGLLRLRAFLLSAAFGGAAGALFVHTNRVVSPETLGFGVMITCLTMTVVGGRFGILGAVIGALLLTHLPEWFRGLDEYYLVAVGVLLLAMVVFAPDGLASFFKFSGSTHTPISTPAQPGSTEYAPPVASGRPVLEASNMSRRYGGVQALDGVDLALGAGEIVGLIGPNGAGKTTLANIITGIARADTGNIRSAGLDLARATPTAIARHGVARTFQTPQLPDGLTVREAVETAAANAGDTANVRGAATAAEAIATCDLSDIADTRCGTLPHGLRRRVEIARALAGGPHLLVLDEPAAGLAPEEQAEIAQILRTLAGSGLAILVIDHNLEFLQPLATRLACLDAGRLIADGPRDDVLANDAVQAAYFGLVMPTSTSGVSA